MPEQDPANSTQETQPPTDSGEHRKLCVEYWTTRLEHTLTHTQTSSRLIYLIDGALLAFIYFIVQSIEPTRTVILVASVPMLLLCILNALHARFIHVQHVWYRDIDRKLLEQLGQDAIRPNDSRGILSSTHGLYRLMHIAISAVAFLAAIAMWLYGQGCSHCVEFYLKAPSV